jgi:hypothetical protein
MEMPAEAKGAAIQRSSRKWPFAKDLPTQVAALFTARLRIAGVQGGSFGFKVLDRLGDQDQCELVVDRSAQLPKADKLPVDRGAPVAHGGSLCRYE